MSSRDTIRDLQLHFHEELETAAGAGIVRTNAADPLDAPAGTLDGADPLSGSPATLSVAGMHPPGIRPRTVFTHLMLGTLSFTLVAMLAVHSGQSSNPPATETGEACVEETEGYRCIALHGAGTLRTAAPPRQSGARIRRQRRERQAVSSVGSGSAAPRRERRFRRAPAGFTPGPQPAAGADRPDAVRGVYLTANSVRSHVFQETIDALKDVERPTIVFDVKGGVVFFDTTSPLAREWGTALPYYDLPAILKRLRERRIYSIARFVAIKDENLTNIKPELSVRHPKTNALIRNGWIDPAHPDAIAYNMQVICDLAAAGIDEINLDYIRFSTANPAALSAISTEDKAARVETFVRSARETIDRCGFWTKLGISTYAILGWNREINLPNLGQDVARLAPYVDIISPMAYPATFAEGAYYIPGQHPGPRAYYLVYQTLKGYEEWIGPEHAAKIRPWLQAYGLGANDIAAEIRATYDAGYCGFQFWNANNNYGPAYAGMKLVKEMPERCTH
ncbi:MAG: Uncharacterized protein Greene041619_770 [Candidatus Peregrinibacteria bacterium Greene0416_19]|nr:MAG: Uncharacterized protein Greene041619_770 [Candidatus Peregrinibacteria bacterium Greene0416_19]